MKTDQNLSHQVQAHAYPHTGFAPPSAVPLTSGTHYTCVMHPETEREAPQECPQCGATLIPTDQAVAHAAMALRSLSAAAQELRLYPV